MKVFSKTVLVFAILRYVMKLGIYVLVFKKKKNNNFLRRLMLGLQRPFFVLKTRYFKRTKLYFTNIVVYCIVHYTLTRD